MKVDLQWQGGIAFEARSDSGHRVTVDGAPDVGGHDAGMRPMELLLSGAAACTAVDVMLILAKSRQSVTGCRVEADAERAPTDPKVFTRIVLTYRISGPGLDRRAVERAVSLSKEKYCSATIMLAKTAAVETRIEIVDTAA